MTMKKNQPDEVINNEKSKYNYISAILNPTL